jgi:aspartyl-tRNA(Asn)/glutamyl-tRNA(Gln) amidotransferase subunit B
VEFEPVIGIEVHAELQTKTKMFCSCEVVDSTHAIPNAAVCPVCSGMPGVLPVVNQKAVEFALRVAIALECEIAPSSIFARKNYFYPDLPKGYQISQYEQPLARNGRLPIVTTDGHRDIPIRRVHIEEDTGKLTHIHHESGSYSLIDLNRAGVPLLEIVSEPDLHSVEEVRNYVYGLRSILRYLDVNSGDMEKGLIRIEPNISIRPIGSKELGTRVEIKNLNSFRALERSLIHEIERQREILISGKQVDQETVGWDEELQQTVPQRVKEAEDDYRYFPEPDLPPLVVTPEWVDAIREIMPELPFAKNQRFQREYSLNTYDAGVLVSDRAAADFFEAVMRTIPENNPKQVSNWISGELFSLLNQAGMQIEDMLISPQDFSQLIQLLNNGLVNNLTAKSVLAEMFESGKSPEAIVREKGLAQISDADIIEGFVKRVLDESPVEVRAYLEGKGTLFHWFLGQVMAIAEGKANPQLVRQELERQLRVRKDPGSS